MAFGGKQEASEKGSKSSRGSRVCSWTSNEGSTPCTVPASMFTSPYGGSGFCTFHYDCASNQAQHSATGFREWLDTTRDWLDSVGYGRTLWTTYTEAALWGAMNGKGLPPLERNVRKDPPASPAAVHNSVKAAMAVVRRQVGAQEAIDALHAEHGCPPRGCSDHPGGQPRFDGGGG